MKKIVVLLCLFSLLLAACGKTAPGALKTGIYMADTDEEGFAPYFCFDPADGTWNSSGSIAMDFALTGSYQQKGNEITATADNGDIVCTLELQPDGALQLQKVKQPEDSAVWWLEEGAVFRYWEQTAEAVLPADEALARAKEEGMVVMEELKCTGGKDFWEAFTDSVAQKEPGQVICVNYYPASQAEEEGPSPAVLYFTTLSYDGSAFTLTVRNSEEETPETQDETYRYLMHYEGEGPAGALFSTYDYWVLTDDDTLTWEQLERSLYSSDSADFIRHHTVFADTN